MTTVFFAQRNYITIGLSWKRNERRRSNLPWPHLATLDKEISLHILEHRDRHILIFHHLDDMLCSKNTRFLFYSPCATVLIITCILLLHFLYFFSTGTLALPRNRARHIEMTPALRVPRPRPPGQRNFL